MQAIETTAGFNKKGELEIDSLPVLKPVVSVSELMKTVKAKSSKYINDYKLTAERFEWQGAMLHFHTAKLL